MTEFPLLLREVHNHNLRTLVETGIYEGDTIEFMRHHVDAIYSIERHPDYYWRAAKRFRDCENVIPILGDSAVELPKLLLELHSPILFWLDAHGEDVTNPHDYRGPILQELAAIFTTPIKGVVLVDDVPDLPVKLPDHYGWNRSLEGRVMRYSNVD